MWLALSLRKTATIGVPGHETDIPFSSMADGCCGVLLAFETYEQAIVYTGEGGDVVQIEAMPCNA